MRNLTIKRAKCFTGCLAKIKIYIVDPAATELHINNLPCRKIGELKNGEEKTFQIDEASAKIVVIGDKLSKDYCNEYYQLPEGQEDISLSGKCEFNPAVGNVFRFDNNENPEAIENRKSGTRKGLLVLLVAAVIGLIIGFLLSAILFPPSPPQEKTFSSNGMVITLTDEFVEADFEQFTVAYESKDVAVFILKEELLLMGGAENYTLQQYADLVIQANELGDKEIKTDHGLTYFEYDYTNQQTNNSYHYFACVYKTNDAFWLIQFTTASENFDNYNEIITQWAQSVSFAE